ncbi:KH domain-containing protein [Halanaerobium praevalens]|uniref:RNA-binding protein KhpA n=1 Tax=Halanaerobium praevalens (strain ATCC 33744 / DSM 2228 / GSL) TaxID=572479 RepID=E3DRN2_HALPG|nr:KH domain-containing protein [Halanaerobium praevalens]ADO77073.1 RNA-binding protein (KH domain) [Halanaerobium praevalens DSM 2228]
MEKLIKFIAESIVDNPSEVTVNKIEKNNSLTVELSVADEDMGKVIGKRGRIAKAIRTVVNAAAAKEGTTVKVDIK